MKYEAHAADNMNRRSPRTSDSRRTSDFVLRTFLACLCLSAPLIAQAPLAFDVASIKPKTSGAMGEQVRFFPPSGRVQMTNVSVRRLILQAYQLQESQLTGGPKWIDTERFDIAANAEGVPNPTPPQRWEMIKSLLIDRFKLKVHAESRELSVFALVLSHSDGKPGAQLRQFEGDCSPTSPRTAPSDLRAATVRYAAAGRQGTSLRHHGHAGTAALWTSGRSVVDRTGLTGRFTLDSSLRRSPRQTA
jgi:uncharacterized protein (TIGR03435 family)